MTCGMRTNQDKWDGLRSFLVYGGKGSSILVTTRLLKVAEITKSEGVSPHQLSLLSENDCWELFRQRAFGSKEKEREEFMTIGRDIVRKCGGVPLAAKTLGSFLRFESNEKEWLSIEKSEIWNLSQEGDSILSILKLSYLNLSANVRPCFAYLAVYPKNQRMSKKQVIELWMANGFISAKGRREIEDVGDRVWNELHLKSFFVDVEIDEFGYDTWFNIHDLVHDLAQSVMKGECCSIIFKNDQPREKTRHLSLNDIEQSCNLWSSHLNKVKCLKSFIILQDYYSGTNNYCDRLLKCYHLWVLDLKFSNEVSCHIDRLKHLRYLNLSDGKFTLLLDSICRLWNLQILNLNKCRSLKELPNQLKCLKSLRHLHLEECPSLSRMAPEMGQLTCLMILSAYIVGVQKGFLLEEVENLKLEGTLHIKHLERVTSVMDAKKAKLADKRLNQLELSWERSQQSSLQENEEKVLEVLQPREQLKGLGVRGYLGTQLPQWMISPTLKDLIRLELMGCKNLSCISSLAKLPSLKYLSLLEMNEVQYIDEESYVDGVDRGFQALEDLKLKMLPRLLKLSREDGDNMFPRLSKLKITKCPQLNLMINDGVDRGFQALEDLMLVDLPSLIKLSRGDSDNMFPRLSKLFIVRCPQLNLPFLPSVTILQVFDSRVLLGSIQNLSNLERLFLCGDGELTPFPDKMLEGLKHLKQLQFSLLPKLEVLPTGLANLKALKRLVISFCNNLETITEEALRGLCSLENFEIWECRRFKLSAGFRHLMALQHLSIFGCPEVEDIHDALQHITTLRSLCFCRLLNLASLPHWLGNLGSLELLMIRECPKLMSLPMSTESLANLKYLQILGCSELVKRCKEGTGEDWHKIAHVPHRLIH